MGHNLSLRRRRMNARGMNARNSRRWPGPLLSLGIGNRANVSLGTGNSAYRVFSRVPGTGGNTTTFRVVVAGASTPASVTVTGVLGTNAAVTFNSATSAGSAATSTVAEMVRAVNGSVLSRPIVHVQSVPGSDATGIVAAVAATALAGAV